jgi:hypothetical protein
MSIDNCVTGWQQCVDFDFGLRVCVRWCLAACESAATSKSTPAHFRFVVELAKAPVFVFAESIGRESFACPYLLVESHTLQRGMPLR